MRLKCCGVSASLSHKCNFPLAPLQGLRLWRRLQQTSQGFPAIHGSFVSPFQLQPHTFTLQAFDVRGVASDPHYLVKASLCVFVGISLNVSGFCRPPHQSLAAMAVSPPLLFCLAFVALLTGYCQCVACGVTRGHTLAQQLQGITFDTKNKKQETRKLLTKSGDIYNFSYSYRLEVATELLVLIVGHCLHLLSSSVSSVYAHEVFFFFLNLCLCVCQAPVPSHVPSPVSTPGC